MRRSERFGDATQRIGMEEVVGDDVVRRAAQGERRHRAAATALSKAPRLSNEGVLPIGRRDARQTGYDNVVFAEVEAYNDADLRCGVEPPPYASRREGPARQRTQRR